METIKGQYRDIGYTAWWHSDGQRLSLTAQLMRNDTPFFTIEEGACVAGCAQASMRGFATWAVEHRIEEEIEIAKSGQHPAGPFLT